MNDLKWAKVSSMMSMIGSRQDEIRELINDMVAFLTDEEKNNELETNKEVLVCLRCAELERQLKESFADIVHDRQTIVAISQLLEYSKKKLLARVSGANDPGHMANKK